MNQKRPGSLYRAQLMPAPTPGTQKNTFFSFWAEILFAELQGHGISEKKYNLALWKVSPDSNETLCQCSASFHNSSYIQKYANRIVRFGVFFSNVGRGVAG